VIRENVVYDLLNLAGAARVGYNTGVQYYRYTVADNWFIGGGPTMRVWNLNQSSFTGNVTYNPCNDGCRMDMIGNKAGWVWSGNTHYGNSAAIDWSYNNSNKTWADWKAATGLGGSDSYVAGVPPMKVWVRPNAYEPGRANVVVYQGGSASSASVDLTGIGLQSGQAWEIRNAQNFYAAPVLTGTGPGIVTLPLAGLTKAAIVGPAPKAPTNPGAKFNAFVVLPR